MLRPACPGEYGLSANCGDPCELPVQTVETVALSPKRIPSETQLLWLEQPGVADALPHCSLSEITHSSQVFIPEIPKPLQQTKRKLPQAAYLSALAVFMQANKHKENVIAEKILHTVFIGSSLILIVKLSLVVYFAV